MVVDEAVKLVNDLLVNVLMTCITHLKYTHIEGKNIVYFMLLHFSKIF